jgi:ParB/RepB/Spo0J family partition protein
MSTTTGQDGFRAISLEDLQVSTTGSQAERRAHFNKAAMAELASSIKEHGVLIPIIARPVNGHFEVVAGERRYLAAKTAGLTAVTCDVRSLSDEQVLEIQLIENLQREGLHELAEAEGYEALLNLGHSAEEIAGKVGKSKGYVYNRMKLLALSKAARTAFYDGKLTASTALLIARISPESVQLQALKEVIEDSDSWSGGVMSYREALDHIQHNYMLRLKDAPFPTGDETLVPAAGACTVCPKNTAQQRELFKDVEHASAGVCTDTMCFKSKREAWGAQALERAKASGQKVIEGKQAEKIAKFGTSSLQGGYVNLDEWCLGDSKHRTYRAILGKSAAPTLLVDPKSGDAIEVVQKSVVTEQLPKSARTDSGDEWRDRQRAEEKKRKKELDFRRELFTRVRLMSPDKLDRADLEAIAEVCFAGIGYEPQKQLLKAWGWTDKGDKPMDPYAVRGKRLKEEIAAHSDAELVVFLLDCVYAEEIGGGDIVFKPERLLAAAKRLNIDPDKLRKELAKNERAGVVKVHPAKAAKKKSKSKK